MEHFLRPRNAGAMEDADGVGSDANPVCGDMTTIYIKLKKGRIEETNFTAFGCVAAIAAASAVTELSRGRRLSDALKIQEKSVLEALDGLPTLKIHCAGHAINSLRRAIQDYREGGRGVESLKVREQFLALVRAR